MHFPFAMQVWVTGQGGSVPHMQVPASPQVLVNAELQVLHDKPLIPQ
jgi:hypothetical protein